MTTTPTTRKTSQLLARLADQLDISDSHFEVAESRYQSVANWLARDASAVADRDSRIYPQGSFLLGTVVKPVSHVDEYDIDLVCEVAGSKLEWTQDEFKELIGAEIKAYARANNMNAPAKCGRRCWTLEYADGAQFHMDILPALPQDPQTKGWLRRLSVDSSQADLAIAITDDQEPTYRRLSNDWPQSNPRGFAEWFRQRSRPRVQVFAEAQISQVPQHRRRTVLQRVVQVLKRHRDRMFAEAEDGLAPISVIISTLAARAYQGEEDLVEAVAAVATNLLPQIVNEGGVYLVRNPVNPDENFADKWEDHPERREAFFTWAKQLRADFEPLAGEDNVQKFSESLRPVLGGRAVDEAVQTFEDRPGRVIYGAPMPVRLAPVDRFNLPHRQKPPWPAALRHTVSVVGEVTTNGRKQRFSSDGPVLPKHQSLSFRATTDPPVPRPIEVYWQVINTGDEATRAGGLRGGFDISKTAGVGGLHQNETTLYSGTHSIECFIVKDSVCVARSGPFVVNIQ
ncbi:MAG: nucleotidyltransferase [Armatimonadetes bacterium]|nr:nucleotidyltransferase [Armatimonadota bacterium]